MLTDPKGRLLNLQHDNSFHNSAPEDHKGNPTPPSWAVVKENRINANIVFKRTLSLSAAWFSVVMCNNRDEIITVT